MEKEIEIYYDHYKDTFSYISKYIVLRDKYFKYAVGMLVLLFFSSVLPSDFNKLSQAILKKNIGIENLLNFRVIESFMIFVIFSISIKYFQINLLIERQYYYLHEIENNLSSKLKNFNIYREGKAYKDQYPLFNSIVHRIYTIAFPTLLLILVFIFWLKELQKVSNFKLFSLFSFNTIMSFGIIGITIFYLIWIHFKDFKKEKNKS